jgi:hypothetical protein
MHYDLGGAISTIAAVDLYTSFPSLDVKSWSVFTIGQPRVGNYAFSNWTRSFPFSPIKRLVFENDLVPHLPPHFAGFEHAPREIWIHDDLSLECSEQEEGKESQYWFVQSSDSD